MTVVYYALGGGHGHAVRGLALLRRLRARDPGLGAVLVAPERFRPWAAREGVAIAAPPQAVCQRRESLAAWLRETLPACAIARVLVDTFPRGVLGELPETLLAGDATASLVARRVRPALYLHPGVRAYLEARYARILWCEEPEPLHAALALPQVRVPPLLIRRAGECLDRDSARRALGAAADDALVLALGSGGRERERDLLRLLVKATARLAPGSPRLPLLRFVSSSLPERALGRVAVVRLYPAMRYLRAADLVVAAGGYHAFHEVRALGVPAVFIPQPRRHDDQALRVSGSRVARSPEELESAMAEAARLPVLAGVAAGS